jgi:hypothetical protein
MLQLFARLRGVLEPERSKAVESAIRRMQLTHWADRLSRDYSGECMDDGGGSARETLLQPGRITRSLIPNVTGLCGL